MHVYVIDDQLSYILYIMYKHDIVAGDGVCELLYKQEIKSVSGLCAVCQSSC